VGHEVLGDDALGEREISVPELAPRLGQFCVTGATAIGLGDDDSFVVVSCGIVVDLLVGL
jgi:hypothetical protein